MIELAVEPLARPGPLKEGPEPKIGPLLQAPGPGPKGPGPGPKGPGPGPRPGPQWV